MAPATKRWRPVSLATRSAHSRHWRADCSLISQARSLRNGVVEDLLVERRIFAAAVLARVVDEELALRDAGRAEGVGLDDVGAGLEKAAVDVADHLRLREREEVAVVEQVLLRVLEALAAHVRLCHAVGADGGAHGAVDDGDALLEDLFKRMLVLCLFIGYRLNVNSVAVTGVCTPSA